MIERRRKPSAGESDFGIGVAFQSLAASHPKIGYDIGN
jgi:hypothetical protein